MVGTFVCAGCGWFVCVFWFGFVVCCFCCLDFFVGPLGFALLIVLLWVCICVLFRVVCVCAVALVDGLFLWFGDMGFVRCVVLWVFGLLVGFVVLFGTGIFSL